MRVSTRKCLWLDTAANTGATLEHRKNWVHRAADYIRWFSTCMSVECIQLIAFCALDGITLTLRRRSVPPSYRPQMHAFSFICIKHEQHLISYVSWVAEHESAVKRWTLKMADPIWRPLTRHLDKFRWCTAAILDRLFEIVGFWPQIRV